MQRRWTYVGVGIIGVLLLGFVIILAGVSFYLFAIQRRMRRYQF